MFHAANFISADYKLASEMYFLIVHKPDSHSLSTKTVVKHLNKGYDYEWPSLY
jgi:hypothetical protein